jgi:hypothetical protein
MYASNRPSGNTEFWKSLETMWEDQNPSKPDILLGDFNLTENPIDRVI